VEVCAGAQVLAVEFDAALGDDGLEIGKGRKVGVHDRLVEHGPETLRGLKLGCVARQMEQPDPVWNAKVRFGVPAGLVQHEHEAATMLRSRPAALSAAKAARSAAKNALETPVERDQIVSPERGWVKAVT
jgi:hypothetical protein